jgi:rhodanese-related sulfurtransferase
MIFGFHEPSVPAVEAEAVKHAIDTKEPCVILDVRTPGEFSRGKVQGSMNLPVEQVESEVKTRLPDTKQKIYVYCLSGARSSVAVEAMVKLGYTNVFNMSHGLLGWRAKYFPVVV